MFRDLVRKKQQLSKEDCISVLKHEPRGVLSVIGDSGYPYGMPMNHFYDEENGKLYFHGGRSGHKIDALKSCDKVSYCVYDKGFRRENEWALNIKSVIVFGRITFVEDMGRVIEISRQLSYKFTDDDDYIEKEIEEFAKNTLCLELEIEHMSGKLVNES